MKAMIAMGVSLGIVGLLFTIYCNVQLKTAKCQTYSVDHTEKIIARRFSNIFRNSNLIKFFILHSLP